MRSLTHLLVTAAAALALFPAGVAWAGNFDVNPVRVELTPSTRSALFTVRNQSAELVRFQVSAFAWSQTSAGEMVLKPTQDIVFFPSMLSIPPGESRKIRVGSTMAFAAVEQSYRVFVEELPPPGAGRAGAVRVLTRMGMPVFVASLAPKPEPVVRGLALRGTRLSFAVDDRGTAHFMTRSVRVVAKDAAGRPVVERTLSGWYVLPGGSRDYAIDIPADACANVASIEVYADTDAATVSGSLSRIPAACT